MHVCQPPVYAVVTVGKSCVIDSKLVEHCGVKVVTIRGVLRGFVGPLIARAIRRAAFETASSDPCGKGNGL